MSLLPHSQLSRPEPGQDGVPDARPIVDTAARLLLRRLPLPQLLEELSYLVGRELGFDTVAINLYRPAWDDVEVVAVYGNVQARAALVGSISAREEWELLLDPRFDRGGVFLIEHGEMSWDAVAVRSFVPSGDVVEDAMGWHPEDALLVPLRASDGHLLGVISVDEPHSGRRPDAATLSVLATLGLHAAVAIEIAQAEGRREADRRALDRLSRITPLLTARFSLESTLDAACQELRDALGFERVAVELFGQSQASLSPAATAGWPAGDAALEIELSRDELLGLLDTYQLSEGCLLLTPEEAHALIGERAPTPYESRSNGRGPYAWRKHWLLAPLRDSRGSVAGFVWVDDPVDRLLPSRERLQALRLFADQIATALALAEQFAALERSREAHAAVINAAPVAVIELGLDRVVRSWNPAAERIFGWSAEQAIGRPNPIVPAEEWSEHVARTDAVLAGRTVSGHRRRLRKDGALIEVHLRATPILDDRGTVTGMVVIAEDVGERAGAG